MDKGKEKEFIIDLNDEDFDYQYDSIVKTESDEEAILVSDNIFNDLTVEDIWKMEFSSVDEAEEFYNLFAKVTGFSVRKDDVKRDKNQNIVSLTRVGCEATFRIGFNKQMNKWVVKEFMVDHNHPLVEQKNVQFLRSHRVIKNADKAQLNAMRGVGIGTSQIMDYMVQQSGGYNNVGFTKKDLYNHVDADRRVHLRDGDAEGALAYLCGKSEMDPSFYYKYNVDEDNHLANLFWADSTNESVSTYTWVLETFLDAMNNKKPLSVITDGDKAMRKAIKRIFPDSCHRLCAWHIQRNAFTNVHVKDFTNHFSKCMFMEGTVEEFECAWNDMLEMFNLHGHKWVTDIYAKRSRWAEAYLRGHFFAGMKSTQRCESMNAYLNRFLKTRLKLFEFVKHFDRALSRIRHNEAKAEFETHHSSAVLTTKLYALEKYAGTVFTRQSFLKFRNEMKNAELFFSVSTENHGGYRVHTLTKFRSPDKIWKVCYGNSDRSMKCTCMMFESVGFPCPHMIVVMKIEHLEEIPETCIMKRWSKLAKETVQVHHDNESQSDATTMCSRMSYFASQSEKAFKEARCEIQRLTFQMEELCKNSVEESEREDLKATKHHVRDPIIVKTKGNPGNLKDKFKKPRHCGKCKKVGHTVRKCPEFVNTHNAFINIEDSIEDMGDMHSLLNHNMEGGSRHGTNEFSQNTTLGTFQNPETSLNDSWLGLHPPNYFTNQVRVIE
ncbi:Protein FAR1-related sequence 5 [Vitis vinifera]|uniref:Protein FAR1-related sequence 5 n=1 Tax=Vitis vinifera TaxID=29760 RepID=A0A438JNW0_VITVI|nr:Protein FAR1-related sequence 5 [Vitis vinifera]